MKEVFLFLLFVFTLRSDFWFDNRVFGDLLFLAPGSANLNKFPGLAIMGLFIASNSLLTYYHMIQQN